MNKDEWNMENTISVFSERGKERETETETERGRKRTKVPRPANEKRKIAEGPCPLISGYLNY